MNMQQKYINLFEPWLMNKGFCNEDSFSYSTTHGYLRVKIGMFKKWKSLRKKYNNEELMDFFIEVVRKDVPELKGTKIYFTDKNPYGENNLNLPNRLV